MPRVSFRNFLTLFRAVDVDAAERGPDVSDDIQLIYIADDLRQTTAIDAGSGTTEAAVVAENGFISLECRNRRGLEVVQVTMNILIPAFGTTLRIWTSAVQPAMTGPQALLTTLRTTGLVGLGAAPLSIATSGTLPTGSIPVTAFRMLDAAGFTKPFFINQGQFFNVALNTANVAVDLGIRWRELRLFP